MADPAYPAALGRAILERTDPRFAPGSGPPVQKPSALGALGYLPPEARSAYMSLVRTIAGLSPGAAVRDVVESSGDVARGALNASPKQMGVGLAEMGVAALGAVPGGRLARALAKQQPIRAYHGSPHDFDKFDISKIGTGEGAQSYGHGLYFAGNEDVAKFYKQSLALASKDDAERMAAVYLDSYGDHALDAIKRDAMARNAHKPTYEPAIQLLQSGWKPPTGHMYEVNIHADPARFLDWDKPLSGQSPAVRNALEPYRSAVERDWASNPTLGQPTIPGQVIAGSRSLGMTPEEDLAKIGIPGIRYLDQGSRGVQVLSPNETVSGQWVVKQVPNGNVLYRGMDEAAARAAGEGSSNYVVFDDKIIEILRKYGWLAPTTAVGAGAATMPSNEGQAY